MFVIVTRYVGEIEPVCFEVAQGEAGIPIFDTVEDAEEFTEAYWELLGPGVEVLELADNAMGQLLGECVDKSEYVIFNPRPVWPSGGSVWWEMVDIRQFTEGLGESPP